MQSIFFYFILIVIFISTDIILFNEEFLILICFIIFCLVIIKKGKTFVTNLLKKKIDLKKKITINSILSSIENLNNKNYLNFQVIKFNFLFKQLKIYYINLIKLFLKLSINTLHIKQKNNLISKIENWKLIEKEFNKLIFFLIIHKIKNIIKLNEFYIKKFYIKKFYTVKKICLLESIKLL